MFVDTFFYGGCVGVLSLCNFIYVAFVVGPGTAHTHECNAELNDMCRYGRGPLFWNLNDLVLYTSVVPE
jgi:hypothetical protein